MTVASTLTTRQYVSTGVNTQFAFPNKIFAASDLVVTIYDLAGNAFIFTNFANAALGLTFSVQNVDVDTGSTVVLSAPFTLNWTIDIRSLVADTQSTSIKNQGQFLPELHEEAFDRSTRQIQDLLRLTYTFGIHGPDTETAAWPALPVPSLRKGYGLMFDALTGLPGLGFLSAQNVTLGLLAPLLNLTQTVAEVTAGITPTTLGYPEGDIRRYNASTGAANNAPAITNALAVSQAGGRAAYLPAGTWAITTAVTVPSGASLIGEGNASILQPNGCDGLVFALDAQAQPIRRSFSKFAIIGTTGTNFSGIKTTVAPSAAWMVDFSNITVQNFGTAIFAQGFRSCTWKAIDIWNCYYGFYFIGQNTNNELWGCQIIRGTITGSGGSWGISFQQGGGLTTQSTQILGCYVYSYDIDINVVLAFELQIDNCDLSNALSVGVQVQSTIGGFWLENCWIETNNAAVTNGVLVSAITPSVQGHVVIRDNYINCDVAVANSRGISIGNGNAGTKVTGNKVIGFDGGITIGACPGLICRDNTINITATSTGTTAYNANSYALNYTTNIAPDNVVGPNYIVMGAPQAATMANTSANITIPNSALFPVNSPVQFDAAVNGFFKDVSYYVLTSAANVITVGNVPGGTAITATGATAVNALQAPLPLNLAAGLPTPGFQFFGRGSFIGKLSDPVLSGPIDWMANGYTCTFYLRSSVNLTGTSTTTSMTLSGMPGFLLPITTQQFPADVMDSAAFQYGIGSFSAATITFFKTPNNGAFTAAGVKGLGSIPMTYTFT